MKLLQQTPDTTKALFWAKAWARAWSKQEVMLNRREGATPRVAERFVRCVERLSVAERRFNRSFVFKA